MNILLHFITGNSTVQTQQEKRFPVQAKLTQSMGEGCFIQGVATAS